VSERAVLEYRRATDAIRSMITSGKIGVGDYIKVPEIEKLTNTTNGTAREAARRLVTEGILQAHQGKGFEVVATPEQAEVKRADLSVLSEEVAELQQQVTDLRERVGRMEASYATSTGKPPGGRRDQAKATAGGGR
jgi:DNA-binding GntR family transcriptional regulator